MDKETRQVLASICELMREECRRSISVDNSLIAVARTILEKHDLWKHYAEQWGKTMYADQQAASPQNHGTLRRLDELIQRLKDDPSA